MRNEDKIPMGPSIPFADVVAALVVSLVLFGILWLAYPPIHVRLVTWHLASPPPADDMA